MLTAVPAAAAPAYSVYAGYPYGYPYAYAYGGYPYLGYYPGFFADDFFLDRDVGLFGFGGFYGRFGYGYDRFGGRYGGFGRGLRRPLLRRWRLRGRRPRVRAADLAGAAATARFTSRMGRRRSERRSSQVVRVTGPGPAR